MDGKKLRDSHSLKGGEAVHAVRAWAAENTVTLAQEFVTEKSNEIEAIPRFLELLDLKGHLVTIDAMGTHTPIAERITAQGGDQLLALKGNQGNQCHWVLDAVFREDRNQTATGNAAKNLGTARRILLNILNDDRGVLKSIPKKRLEALMNTT